jgi:hypothetical protein
MTPREALETVKRRFQTLSAATIEVDALVTLDQLVSKDEADRKFAMPQPQKFATRAPVCTCGTVNPRPVLGHS